MDILYDVEDAENDKLTIRIEISADGGERYNVPAHTFEGAVGANVDSGKDRKITWNAGLDWDGEFSDKMWFRVTASDGCLWMTTFHYSAYCACTGGGGCHQDRHHRPAIKTTRRYRDGFNGSRRTYR